jgi:hypothetical protein
MALSDELKTHVSDENWNKGKRIREEISLTAKGYVQPSVTLETLNMDKVIVVKSPDDVADVTEYDTTELLFKKLDRIAEEAHKRGLKMVYEA